MPPHPAGTTTETCATQLEPEEVEAAAPAPPVPEASLEPEEAEAAAPAGSCAGAWEIKDSEDEDEEAEILQIQEAVAEARARLHQLQLDAGALPCAARGDPNAMDNLETQELEVPLLDLPDPKEVLTRIKQHDLKKQKKELAAAKKKARKTAETEASETPKKLKNRKPKGKKARKTKPSRKRAILRRMSEHSFTDSLASCESPPSILKKPRSSPASNERKAPAFDWAP
ncbi:unnamed protein product, partial [Symbiodinium sp. CCMP2456]